MRSFRLLHAAVAAALIALLLWKADIGAVGDALSGVDVTLVVAVVALNIPVMLLLFVRSNMVLRALGHDVPVRLLLPAAVLGNVAGSLTPASAGDLLRAAVLRTHADIPAEDGLALVIYERGVSVYLMALGTGAIAAIRWLPLPFALASAGAAGALTLLPIAAGQLLVAKLPLTPRTEAGLRARLLRRASGVAERLAAALGDARLMLRWSPVTAAIFGINALQLWLVTESVSGGVRIDEAWIGFGASQLAGIVSLLPLGLGAADGSLAALLRQMSSLSLDESTAVAVLVRLAMTLPLGVSAVGAYLYLLAQRAVASPPAASGEDEERRSGRRDVRGGGTL